MDKLLSMKVFQGKANRTVYGIAIALILLVNLGIGIYFGAAQIATGLAGGLSGDFQAFTAVKFVASIVYAILGAIGFIVVVRRENDSESQGVLIKLWLVGVLFNILHLKFLFFIRPFTFFILAYIIGLTKPSIIEEEVLN